MEPPEAQVWAEDIARRENSGRVGVGLLQFGLRTVGHRIECCVQGIKS